MLILGYKTCMIDLHPGHRIVTLASVLGGLRGEPFRAASLKVVVMSYVEKSPDRFLRWSPEIAQRDGVLEKGCPLKAFMVSVKQKSHQCLDGWIDL